MKILLTGKNKDYSFIFYSITPQGAGLHETEYPMRVNLEMIEPDAEYWNVFLKHSAQQIVSCMPQYMYPKKILKRLNYMFIKHF